MKKLLKSAFLFSLAAVFAFGLSIAFTPEANASSSCPTCLADFSTDSSWTRYGNCADYSDPHCPVFYLTYKNNSGKICRGINIIANL